MIARIAYLSTPAPGRYILNFQVEGEECLRQFEISRAHLANLIIDGTTLALRENQAQSGPSNRVPVSSQTESAPHERTEHRT